LDELQNYYDEIKKYDGVVLAVSVKSPEINQKIKDKYELGYPMLCDVNYQAVNKYGIPRKEGEIYPSTFIIDKKGIVVWRHIGQSDKDTVDSRLIIEKLRESDGEN